MKKLLAMSVVSIALLGVLTGSLLRPCDCGTGGGVPADATSAAGSPCVACCCSGNEAPAGNQGEDGDEPGDEPGDDGCDPCCKPPPPAVESAPAATLQPPTFVDAPARPRPALDLGGGAPALARGGAAPPATTPWRLSEEGLTVFRL